MGINTTIRAMENAIAHNKTSDALKYADSATVYYVAGGPQVKTWSLDALHAIHHVLFRLAATEAAADPILDELNNPQWQV